MSGLDLVDALGLSFYLFGLPLSFLIMLVTAFEAASKRVFWAFIGVLTGCVATVIFAVEAVENANSEVLVLAAVTYCLSAIILASPTHTRFTAPILVPVITISVLVATLNAPWVSPPQFIGEIAVFVFLVTSPAFLARLSLRVVKPIKSGV